MARNEGEDAWRFIHPELMSQEELLAALQQRHVKIDEKVAQDKKQLVDLFKRVAMPLSQRSCFRKKVSSPVKMDIDPPHSNRSLQLGSGHLSSSNLTANMNQGHQTQCRGSTTSGTKIRLKRSINELSELNITNQNGPTPKKREKITWP